MNHLNKNNQYKIDLINMEKRLRLLEDFIDEFISMRPIGGYRATEKWDKWQELYRKLMYSEDRR